MVQFNKIFCFLLFIGCSLSVDAESLNGSIDDISSVDSQELTMNLYITINGNIKTQLLNVPTTGYLEVYSILGAKVTSRNLQTSGNGCEIDLPKGLYILKAGKVTQKIIVR